MFPENMTNQEQIYVSALRYALSKKNYIVEITVDFLMKQKLSEICKNIMIKDLKRCKDYGKEWTKLLKHLEDTNFDNYNE